MASNVGFLLLVFCVCASVGQLIPGGAGPENPADEKVQNIVNSVKDEVEAELGHPVAQLTLISYKTQVVAGTNYFAKVDIGEGDESMVHLRIYQDFSQQTSLESLQYPKHKLHGIEYF